jgi:sortase A
MFGFLTNARVGQQQSTEQAQWRIGIQAQRQALAVPSVLVSTTTAQSPSAARQTAAPRKTAAPGAKVSSAGVAPPFLLSIPKIKLRWMIHEGTTIRHLRRTGAGHIPKTALPGQPGVVGIAGHRTTYGAPFFKLNHVGVGDEVTLQTRGGTFVYRVYKVRTVKPTQVEVLKSTTGERLLVLSTCTPPYSAKFRLVVFAKLVPAPSAASGGAN